MYERAYSVAAQAWHNTAETQYEPQLKETLIFTIQLKQQ